MKKLWSIVLLLLLVLTGCSKPYPNFEGTLVLRDDCASRSVIIVGEHAEDVDDLDFFFKGTHENKNALYVGNTKNNGKDIRAKSIELPTEITSFTINDSILDDPSHQKFYIEAIVNNSTYYYTVQWDYEEYSGEMYFDCYLADSDEVPASLVVNVEDDIYIYESHEVEGASIVVENAKLFFTKTSYVVENNVRSTVHVFAYTKDNKNYLSTCRFIDNKRDLKTIEIGNVDDCGFQKVLTKGFFYVIDEKEITIYNFVCEEVYKLTADNDILGVYINSYGDYFLNYAEKSGNSFILKRQNIMI